MSIIDKLKTPTGRIILSIIWGIGLATMFQKMCKGNDCIIYKAPSHESVINNTYFNEGKCYKYNVKKTLCNANPIQEQKNNHTLF